ncbi:hypothetical protein RRG08_046819 [Elysia crispata]|uniref:Uncharacterized protein n=1 Tax=Elysia crispata TaxID=231223 RepID=A0AAE0ZN43_9GAST|nr:hypothetical protein RRG08_046819 [Elysia crispata]
MEVVYLLLEPAVGRPRLTLVVKDGENHNTAVFQPGREEDMVQRQCQYLFQSFSISLETWQTVAADRLFWRGTVTHGAITKVNIRRCARLLASKI